MKEFWVGQKVRLISVTNPACVHKVGDVGVVTSVDPVFGFIPVYSCDFPNGPLYAPAKDLAPVYDGDQPSTWDECVWKPEPEEVSETVAKPEEVAT